MRVQSVTFTAAHKAHLIDGPVHAMQRLAASVGNLRELPDWIQVSGVTAFLHGAVNGLTPVEESQW